MQLIGLLRSPRQIRPTDIVLPLDDDDAPAPGEEASDDLDCFFDDAQLTMQLEAVHRGRGWIVASIVGGLTALVTAMAFVS